MAARQHRNTAADTPVAEWIVAAVGAVLMAGVLGSLLWQAVAVPPSGADVRVDIESVTPGGPGFVAEFVARNSGGTSAEGVVIRGELRTGDRIETADTTLDRVPPRSEVRGGLFFRSDPRQGSLDLRALGYEQP